MSNEEIIELIRRGAQDEALDVLYRNFPAFRNSFVKSGGRRSDAEDLFQDALLILLEKIQDKKFTLSCSMNSFLFSICRNLSLVYFRERKKDNKLQLDDGDAHCEMDSVTDFLQREKQYSALDKILSSVGKKCLEILSLFYVSGLKMYAIAEKMGFSSEVSAKTQKYKCIEKARKLSMNVVAELQTELS